VEKCSSKPSPPQIGPGALAYLAPDEVARVSQAPLLPALRVVQLLGLMFDQAGAPDLARQIGGAVAALAAMDAAVRDAIKWIAILDRAEDVDNVDDARREITAYVLPLLRSTHAACNATREQHAEGEVPHG
jgi:hypothetical protein